MFDRKEPERRSSGSLQRRRVQLDWPKDRDFRILSIDGGGIRGVFPATFLAGLEARYLGGESVGRYFDLITGTSTGGIIALGIAAGLSSAELASLYVEQGREIFPPFQRGLVGTVSRRLSDFRQYFKYRYDRVSLVKILHEKLGDKKLRAAVNRLCIPAFDGRHGEVYIFKTPHHPDFQKDGDELMLSVAAATAAAPTFYQPLQHKGYVLVDGGVWANNPVMIALVDALSCFNLPRERVRILSLGCGNPPYIVEGGRQQWGGLLHWRNVIEAAMHLQSQNALGQAGLLIGVNRITRIDTPSDLGEIDLDDWCQAKNILPGVAEEALDQAGKLIATAFLAEKTTKFEL